MVRRRKSSAVRAIKELARSWALRFPDHAVVEMFDERITKEDMQQAILTGTLKARQTRGMRGTRYILKGAGMDGRSIEVVCRLIPGIVRIITVYRIQ